MSMFSAGLHLTRRPAVPAVQERAFRAWYRARRALEAAAAAQKLSAADLANLTGYTPDTVKRILCGQCRISVEALVSLCTAMRLPPADVIRDATA
jgi:transcriptional regulator with XRE-family HTH domain